MTFICRFKSVSAATTHLGGVHVTPTQLESYKRAAWLADMSITDWVVFQLDKAALRVADLADYVKPKK